MKLRISDIASISIGYQHRGRMEPNTDGECRFIQIKDFDESHRLNPENIVRFTPDTDMRKYIVRPGDVLFLSRGHKNWATMLEYDPGYAVATGYFFILRVKKDINIRILPEFLAWYLNQDPARSVILSQARGSHMPLVPMSAFREIEIEVPPVEVQGRIVELSRLQRRERELCAALLEKRQLIVKHVCMNTLKKHIRNEKENSNNGGTDITDGD
ncbi:MAG TPA: restriction endonuclease subunit S [bacterium]|nr:restriction endonuclease subunit S [bacterium]HPN95308.1 restriction endonuclease subunit S [bacterium]